MGSQGFLRGRAWNIETETGPSQAGAQPRPPFRQRWARTALLVRWVWAHTRSEAVVMAAAMLSAGGASALSAAALVVARSLTQTVVDGKDLADLARPALQAAAVLLGLSACRLASTTLGALAAANVRRNLEIACTRRLPVLPYDYLRGGPTARLSAALFSEMPQVARITDIGLRSFVRAPLTVLLAVAFLWFNSPLVAVVALASCPLMFVGLAALSSLARRATAHAYELIGRFYTSMSEQITGLRVVRSLGRMEWYGGRMRELSAEIARASRRGAWLAGAQQAVQEVISVAILFAFLWWIAQRVAARQMGVAEALMIPGALWMIREEALRISQGFMALRKIEGSAGRLQELLSQGQEARGGRSLPSPLTRVELKDVRFEYRPGEPVLNGVSLDMEPGRLTVIAGPSGSGKSTLCDLCLRLRVPTQGAILFDGADLNSLSEECVRENVALVEQEPYLFDGSIRLNLLLGRQDVEEAALWDALARADAEAFVRRLPQGLDTPVSGGGAALSVGQRQRLAVARALLRRPRFLVLDEFTSSLDGESEGRLVDTMERLSRDIVVLCVSHREAVLGRAGRLYHLEDGRLRPSGAETTA